MNIFPYAHMNPAFQAESATIDCIREKRPYTVIGFIAGCIHAYFDDEWHVIP